MRDLVFLGFWVVLLPLAFRGAHLGVMLWTWTSLLAPNDSLFGIGASVPFAKLAALPTLVMLAFGRRQGNRIRLGRTGFLLLALAAIAIASQATTAEADPAPGWDLCEKYLKVLALGMAVLWTMTDRLRVHGLLIAICLGIGFIAVDEGGKFILSGSAHKVLGSPSMGDNNQIALDVVMIIPLLHYLHATASGRVLRLACVAAGALAAIAVIATFSRGGAIGLAIVGASLVAGSRHKAASIALLVVALAIGAQFVGGDWLARMNTVQDAQGDDSFMGRVIAWKVSTALALSHPFLGGGFHAIQHGEIWIGQTTAVLSLDAIETPPQGVFPRAAHSIYFEVLGDLGFSGLACLLLLLFGAWRDGGAIARMVRRSARPDLAWAAMLAGRLRASLLAFALCGALLSAAYYDIDYLVICLLAAVRRIVANETGPQPGAGRARVARERRVPALAGGAA